MVLGKNKWRMSFHHFTLIFSIFHGVYALLATICDLFFFHSLLVKRIRTRYVSTVLPIHRLFFLVISVIDSLIFVSTTSLVDLVGDVFCQILVFLIGAVLVADTPMVLLGLRAIFTGSKKVNVRYNITKLKVYSWL